MINYKLSIKLQLLKGKEAPKSNPFDQMPLIKRNDKSHRTCKNSPSFVSILHTRHENVYDSP